MFISWNIIVLVIIFIKLQILRIVSTGASEKQKLCVDTIAQDFGWEKPSKRLRYEEGRSVVPKSAFLDKVFGNLTSDNGKDYFRYIHSVIVAKTDTYTPKQYCVFKVKESRSKDMLSRAHMEKKCYDQLFSKIPDPSRQRINFFPDTTDATVAMKDTLWNLKKTDVFEFGPTDYRYLYFFYLSGQYSFSDYGDPQQCSENKVMKPLEFCQLQDLTIRSEPRYFEILQNKFVYWRLERNLESREASSSSKKAKN